ncbi:MAG TPA: lytic transglycosylase domain-containing protein [Bryobacteraceae bacterium]|jgi:Transglycosylase SLT domain|nr:lytic transglycosylase domain-containing protein [Bryobacteraceae bacterium]
MKLALILALSAAAVSAQTPDAIARQRAAIERQRASVRQQVKPNAPSTAGFFTVPWDEPLSPLPDGAPAIVADADGECDPIPKDQIEPMVREIAEREGLTPQLLRAVIEKESSYLPCAVSPAGAEGLMQLMPDTASGLGVDDPFDPRQNVDGGARYLKQMLDRYGGNLLLGLAAYNAGPGRADNAGAFPLPAETTNYVSEILRKLGTDFPKPIPPAPPRAP